MSRPEQLLPADIVSISLLTYKNFSTITKNKPLNILISIQSNVV